MIVALPPMTDPGTMRIAIPAALAFLVDPSLLNVMQGIVAVVVLPDDIIVKLVVAFRDVKLAVGMVSPGEFVNAFVVAFNEL